MRVLVTYGSKMGGTAGIATTIAEVLTEQGLEAEARSSRMINDVTHYDAVVVGGALYANRWHKDARRFIKRNRKDLAARPVWFFSSGPLDDSATAKDIEPTGQVRQLMESVDASGHITFGGMLAEDAKGFPASSMAREMAGDFRDWEQITVWAKGIALELA